MRSIKERRADLLGTLDDVVDAVMLPRGFARRKGAITYSRRLARATQKIDFTPSYSPRFAPGAEVFLYPMYRLNMPEVQEVAFNLVGRDERMMTPDITLNLPITFAAKPHFDAKGWYAYGPDDYPARGREIGEFIEKYLFDLLDDTSEPADLIEAHKVSDVRLRKDDRWHIKVAAAYLVGGDPEGALTVLEKRFRKPDTPKRFHVLFENFPKLAEG